MESLRYVGSAPWPYPLCLFHGFQATMRDGELTPAGTEITSAVRFSRQELSDAVAQGQVSLPAPASMARSMIEDWLS